MYFCNVCNKPRKIKRRSCQHVFTVKPNCSNENDWYTLQEVKKQVVHFLLSWHPLLLAKLWQPHYRSDFYNNVKYHMGSLSHIETDSSKLPEPEVRPPSESENIGLLSGLPKPRSSPESDFGHECGSCRREMQLSTQRQII